MLQHEDVRTYVAFQHSKETIEYEYCSYPGVLGGTACVFAHRISFGAALLTYYNYLVIDSEAVCKCGGDVAYSKYLAPFLLTAPRFPRCCL